MKPNVKLSEALNLTAASLTAGVISDTHGFVMPEALTALQGVDVILHAGDIDTIAVLDDLKRIAPVIAIRGNMDKGRWTSLLFETEIIEIGGGLLYMLHDLNRLDLEPASSGIRIVIHGHTHHASDDVKNGVRFLNPGSASRPRYGEPPSLMKLHISKTAVSPEFIQLP